LGYTAQNTLAVPHRSYSESRLAIWPGAGGLTVWALEWSEIVAKARAEMQLVRDHLKRKSEDLTISEYLKENFPDILEGLTKANEKHDANASGKESTEGATAKEYPRAAG
jgi:hypothetical protein